MKCKECGENINPFDGWTEVSMRQMVGSGTGNPEHPVTLVTVDSMVLCCTCVGAEQ